MMGALLSRAASSEATTVDEEVQFWKHVSKSSIHIQFFVDVLTMAGMANFFCWAYLKSYIAELDKFLQSLL